MNQKKLNRKERGITLIALVITIIVLLILAGIAVSMLSGENGLLQQAKEAELKTEEASQNEQNDLEKTEHMIDQYKEGTIANAASKGKINVGDYVAYEYTEKTYTTPLVSTGKSIHTEPQTFNSGTDVKITGWRVLSIEDGEIKLLADLQEENGSNGVTINGGNGWKNGPTVLNEMCKTLYSGQYGTARSINQEDVDKIMGYNGTRYYRTDKKTLVKVPDDVKTLGQLEAKLGKQLGGERLALEGNIEDVVLNDYVYEINVTGYTNYQDLFKAKPAVRMLLEGTVSTAPYKRYWLASNSVQANFYSKEEDKSKEYLKYALKFVNANAIQSKGCYETSNPVVEESYKLPVRPIVTLNSGLKIDTSDTNRNGSSIDKAWLIKSN